MRAIIDADGIVFRCGFGSEKQRWVFYPKNEPVYFDWRQPRTQCKKELITKHIDPEDGEWHAELHVDPIEYVLGRAKIFLDAIVYGSAADDYIGFIGSKNDTSLFRLNLAKTKVYKGNRVNKAKPIYYDEIREYLLKYHNIEQVEGIEADDAVAMRANKDTVICYMDKDLLQVPGNHYHYINKEHYQIDELEGWRSFYKQVLMGDNDDNIPGLKGIGAITANKLLKDCNSPIKMYNKCLGAYKDKSKRKDYADFMEEVCSLLYLLRHENDEWRKPI